MMTPEINFMQIGVGVWPIIDSRKMTERIRLMTDGGNQMEEIECAKKKKRKRWDYQAIRKGWSQAVRSESIPRTDKL
ncbi:hypothetical protein V1478_001657 [Vespula squamosa]|uniref:Uncharacterized protein n=1 Tax=Vespula squamosa TaxID=30214 RepID=A0ABD2C231_VESSQ